MIGTYYQIQTFGGKVLAINNQGNNVGIGQTTADVQK